MSERIQPCPRCHAETGWRDPVDFSDSRICRACGQRSTNCEISRGKPWTQDEIDQMLEGMTRQASPTERAHMSTPCARKVVISFALPNGQKWNWPVEGLDNIDAFVAILDLANIPYSVRPT